jgi:hypothetical protein
VAAVRQSQTRTEQQAHQTQVAAVVAAALRQSQFLALAALAVAAS